MGTHCWGSEFDLSWISRVQVNQAAVLRWAEQIQARRSVKKEWQAAWLLKAVTCIDLTTLSGDDTFSNVQRLCYKAKYPIRQDLLKALNMHDKGITTAAVCPGVRHCEGAEGRKLKHPGGISGHWLSSRTDSFEDWKRSDWRWRMELPKSKWSLTGPWC
ncbi:putative deoxyribose-phosphate aldolase-like protein [Cricetulus griseus]|uniref:deoxyribose-phosphate aldolase n=1 Tax=Cricetulus griseus TaxID=10029 RepID=A0A061ICA1_CRIGR|nr:putative deoxyribose-phosphate aldolase-like protein [Cricetulus griseus]